MTNVFRKTSPTCPGIDDVSVLPTEQDVVAERLMMLEAKVIDLRTCVDALLKAHPAVEGPLKAIDEEIARAARPT